MIEQAVGRGAPNRWADVRLVQVLLAMHRPLTLPPLAMDGAFGPQTEGAIIAFQADVVRMSRPDGRIDPGGRTLGVLRASLLGSVDALVLRGIMPSATPASIARYLPHLLSGMRGRRIDTRLRQAHFIAQLAHESGSFRYAEELASGDAYEGRRDLGNTQPGDGPRFKGRGLIQLTGRANYTEYGKAIGRDLCADPSPVATDPALAVDAACWFWETRGLNALADNDDLDRVTRRINGGLNGFADRRDYLRRAKFFLGL